MRSTVAFMLSAVAIVFGFNVIIANEKPTPEFQNIMKSNGAAVGALRMHIMAKDNDAIVMDATTLKDNFAKIEAFWTAKKVDDAIAFAKAGAKGAADLEAAGKAKNDEQVAAANKDTMASCSGCHMAHREQLPDRSFEIK